MQTGTLYVVATPIGNRDDLSPRARQVLSEVDLIAAEDTRHTGRLLSHIGCETPQMALHEHNEDRVAGQLVDQMQRGDSVALVCDAGTPLISDPGFRLLQAAHAAGVRVSPVPGPSSVLAALSVAGLATDRFCFEGFLPPKSEARRKALAALNEEPRSLVFLESVHRIGQCLEDMTEVLGPDRMAFIGREMTKIHEQAVRGTLAELRTMLADGAIVRKGEFVIVVSGAGDVPSDGKGVSSRKLLEELVRVLPGRQAAEIVARLTGARKNDVYQTMLEIRSDRDSDD